MADGPVNRKLRSTGAAFGGVVVAHTLTYLVAIGNATTRRHVLSETGHTYWREALVVGGLVLLWSFAAVVARGARAGAAGAEPGGSPLVSLAFRLAVTQVLIFTGIEIGERLVAGVPVGGMFAHGLFSIGLGLQVLTAIVIAVALKLFSRAAEAIGRTLFRPPRIREAVRFAAATEIAFRAPILVSAAGPRAPPS